MDAEPIYQVDAPKEEPDRTHVNAGLGRWVCSILLLLFLYLLSSGPAVKLVQTGILPYQVLYVYHPLKLGSRDTFRPIRWYVYDLWHVKPMLD